MKLKHLLLQIIACSACAMAFAQPKLIAQRTIGGSANDFFSAMDLTRDGGAILGGTSYSNASGEKTQNSLGGSDFWIVKLNKAGQMQWDKTIGKKSNDKLSVLQRTKDDGYILGGTSYDNNSGNSYWIIKLDKNGNILWDKKYQRYDENEGYYLSSTLHSLEQTNDSGYIITGYYVYFDYLFPYWVIKIDSAGNVQWETDLGNEAYYLSVIHQTKDGGYLFGATEQGDRDFPNPKYMVIKLGKTGNTQWTKYYDSWHDAFNGFSDVLYSLRETADGNYIVGGWSDGIIGGNKTENTRGSADYWVLKIDTIGNVLWDKTIGGSDADILTYIKTTSGGFILGGYSNSNKSGEKTENNRGGGGYYDSDYWIVKLDNDGKTIQWDKTIGGDTTDILLSVKEMAPNRYLLGGYSYSGISGDKKQVSRGGADYWVVLLNYKPQLAESNSITSNAARVKLLNKNFVAYPNPAKDILHIQTNGKATFTLTTQSGKVLLTKTISNKGEINVANLAAGLYFLKNNTTGEVEKVIVTK
jgi:hypothetical protein